MKKKPIEEYAKMSNGVAIATCMFYYMGRTNDPHERTYKILYNYTKNETLTREDRMYIDFVNQEYRA